MRLVEVLSSHIELDLSIPLLSTQNSSLPHMFPSHPLIAEAAAFRTAQPKTMHIFPRVQLENLRRDAGGDVAEWITGKSEGDWLLIPPTPKQPSSSSSSLRVSSSGSLAPLVSVPQATARLDYLIHILRERSSLTTSPLVFSLTDVLSLSPSGQEALLREHVLLLYERGEDSRAWESVPRLEDSVCIATSLISIARTRLGLFLHALESKNSGKYASLVSGVPASAWLWLAKAKPPHVMVRRREGEEQETKGTDAGKKKSGNKPPSSTPSSSQYILSSSITPPSASSPSPSPPTDPLHLVLFRPVSIKQKAADIDIHATLTLLKRCRTLLEHALALALQSQTTATSSSSSSSTSSLPPIEGEPFGREGDNRETIRDDSPIRYARAYTSQLVDIALLVVSGLRGNGQEGPAKTK